MKIVERKFAAELHVDGKRLAYDDPGCMVVHYLSFTGAIQPVQGVWPLAKVEKAVVYTYDGEEPVPAFTAWYVVDSSIRTPMLHGILAFKSLTQALEFARREGGDVTGWDGVVQHMLGDRGHETEAHDGHETANAFKIRLRRLDGGHVTVEALLREGRPVLLVFFATWCPTCSKNISTLWRAYQRFGGKVTVLLSSFDP
jgi:thiol-disulfide isomerase/thioredoxin